MNKQIGNASNQHQITRMTVDLDYDEKSDYKLIAIQRRQPLSAFVLEATRYYKKYLEELSDKNSTAL